MCAPEVGLLLASIRPPGALFSDGVSLRLVVFLFVEQELEP